MSQFPWVLCIINGLKFLYFQKALHNWLSFGLINLSVNIYYSETGLLRPLLKDTVLICYANALFKFHTTSNLISAFCIYPYLISILIFFQEINHMINITTLN